MHTLSLLCLVLSLGAVAPSPTKVWFDHDGGVDDFVTLSLLLSKPELVDVIGITVLDADCYADVAVNTTLKVLHTLNRSDIPVAASTFQGANPFPGVWRGAGITVDVLPMINTGVPESYLSGRVNISGEELFTQGLMQQEEPITVVAIGPLSNVAYALEKHGEEAAKRIKEIWWMGGALRVAGNVDPSVHHDGSAEWNAYWDPAANAVVWNSSVDIILVPLDATNQVPVTPDFLYRFGSQSHHLYSSLAGSMWSRAVGWVYETPDVPYYAWDTLTAACLLKQDMCQRVDGLATYAVAAGRSQGRIGVWDEESGHMPKLVSAIMHVEPQHFYDFVLESLRR